MARHRVADDSGGIDEKDLREAHGDQQVAAVGAPRDARAPVGSLRGGGHEGAVRLPDADGVGRDGGEMAAVVAPHRVVDDLEGAVEGSPAGRRPSARCGAVASVEAGGDAGVVGVPRGRLDDSVVAGEGR
jgi:hypothetical protein